MNVGHLSAWCRASSSALLGVCVCSEDNRSNYLIIVTLADFRFFCSTADCLSSCHLLFFPEQFSFFFVFFRLNPLGCGYTMQFSPRQVLPSHKVSNFTQRVCAHKEVLESVSRLYFFSHSMSKSALSTLFTNSARCWCLVCCFLVGEITPSTTTNRRFSRFRGTYTVRFLLGNLEKGFSKMIEWRELYVRCGAWIVLTDGRTQGCAAFCIGTNCDLFATIVSAR